MQGCSGVTSHMPLNGPPHGPLRRFFGHVIGHTYSISPNTQLPQFWHPNASCLNFSSIFSKDSARLGELSSHFITDAPILRRIPFLCARPILSITSNMATFAPRAFGGAGLLSYR